MIHNFIAIYIPCDPFVLEPCFELLIICAMLNDFFSIVERKLSEQKASYFYEIRSILQTFFRVNFQEIIKAIFL